MEKEVIINFSGGKDSTAMLLRMIELGERIDYIVFADTGFEYPELYEYIKKIEKHINRPITILKAEKSFDDWRFGELTRGKDKGKQRGFPQVLTPCYWMRESKFKPIDKFRQEHNNAISCIGIASDEKDRVQKDTSLRYPLIEWGWTEQDCVNYLNKLKLLNPLYINFKRIGCFMCPKQSDYAKWVTWKQYPELWGKVREFEKENLESTNRNIFLRSVEELEKEFNSGKKPKIPKTYECFECKGVRKVFEGDKSLNQFCEVTFN